MGGGLLIKIYQTLCHFLKNSIEKTISMRKAEKWKANLMSMKKKNPIFRFPEPEAYTGGEMCDLKGFS